MIVIVRFISIYYGAEYVPEIAPIPSLPLPTKTPLVLPLFLPLTLSLHFVTHRFVSKASLVFALGKRSGKTWWL